MLDVHAPHERIHGFRDFLLHLLTITIGLLIALGLEGCVEWSHHRHLRDEADANIRKELRDNRKEVAATVAAVAQERQELTLVLNLFVARTKGERPDIHQFSLNYVLGTLSNASWRTASATGALSYMEYAHVQSYATAYEIQDQFSSLQAATLNDFLQLQAYVVGNFDPTKVSVADAQAASADARRALSHIFAMEQFGSQLQATYAKALAPD